MLSYYCRGFALKADVEVAVMSEMKRLCPIRREVGVYRQHLYSSPRVKCLWCFAEEGRLGVEQTGPRMPKILANVHAY